jgi:hypothetical protein
MKKLLFFTALLLASITTFSQLKVKNKIHLPIYFSYGYYESTDNWEGFKTSGWFKVEPNETLDVSIPFKPSGGSTLWYHFQSSNPKMRINIGTMNLLVNKIDAFDIKNAHLPYKKDENKNYEFRAFKRKSFVSTDILDGYYKIDITYDDIN